MSDGTGIAAAPSYMAALDRLRARRELETRVCRGYADAGLRHVTLARLARLLERVDYLIEQSPPEGAEWQSLRREILRALDAMEDGS